MFSLLSEIVNQWWFGLDRYGYPTKYPIVLGSPNDVNSLLPPSEVYFSINDAAVIDAIQEYTGAKYAEINNNLRNQIVDNRAVLIFSGMKYVDLTTHLLFRLEKSNYVLRGVNKYPHELVGGDSFKVKSFWSVAYNNVPKKLELDCLTDVTNESSLSDVNLVVYRILSKKKLRCVGITNELSKYEENEVLLAPGRIVVLNSYQETSKLYVSFQNDSNKSVVLTVTYVECMFTSFEKLYKH